jgi:hypothetical protein
MYKIALAGLSVGMFLAALAPAIGRHGIILGMKGARFT